MPFEWELAASQPISAGRPRRAAVTSREEAGLSAFHQMQHFAGNLATTRHLTPLILKMGITEESLGRGAIAALTRIQSAEAHAYGKGVYYPTDYLRNHTANPRYFPRWNFDWMSGYANPEFFDRVNQLTWTLKPGKSASAAIRAWIEGPTIADCSTTILVAEYEALRLAVGDEAFDSYFGSKYGPVSKSRLTICPSAQDSGLAGLLTGSNRGEGPRVGDWVYLGNHSRYLLKHPAGNMMGENLLYLGTNSDGEQAFSGFGTGAVTKREVYTLFKNAYNAPRTRFDYRILLDRFCILSNTERLHPGYQNREYNYLFELYRRHISEIPKDYQIGFPMEIGVENIEPSPEIEILGIIAKGGMNKTVTHFDPTQLGALLSQMPQARGPLTGGGQSPRSAQPNSRHSPRAFS